MAAFCWLSSRFLEALGAVEIRLKVFIAEMGTGAGRCLVMGPAITPALFLAVVLVLGMDIPLPRQNELRFDFEGENMLVVEQIALFLQS
jgi:hypothetical protein